MAKGNPKIMPNFKATRGNGGVVIVHENRTRMETITVPMDALLVRRMRRAKGGGAPSPTRAAKAKFAEEYLDDLRGEGAQAFATVRRRGVDGKISYSTMQLDSFYVAYDLAAYTVVVPHVADVPGAGEDVAARPMTKQAKLHRHLGAMRDEILRGQEVQAARVLGALAAAALPAASIVPQRLTDLVAGLVAQGRTDDQIVVLVTALHTIMLRMNQDEVQVKVRRALELTPHTPLKVVQGGK